MANRINQIERRERVLSDCDVDAIAARVSSLHTCRFESVTPDDMRMLKDILAMYKETRSELMKWAVRGLVLGSLFVILLTAAAKGKLIK